MQRHRRGLSATVIALLQFLTLPPAIAVASSAQSQGWWAFSLFTVVTSALYWRHGAPLRVLTVVVAGMGLSLFLKYPLFMAWWPAPWMVYHFARYGTLKQRKALLIGGLLASVVGGAYSLRFLAAYSWTLPELLVFWFIMTFMCATFVVVSWLIGNTLRLGELRQLQLEERARRLEHEREQERRLAAQDERSRIAREMHDIVSHSLSSIISLSDGAQYAGHAQRATEHKDFVPVEAQALATISDAARDALSQMRQLLGVLRTDEATAFEPLPAIHNIPQLIEHMQRLGFCVDYSGMAEDADILERLPHGAELTTYRVVQEALTNITKHAPRTPHVWVELNSTHNGLQICVENAPSAHSEAPVPGSRRGMLGMRERINLYHGTLHYGELPSGGFRVEALIPVVSR